MTDEKWFREMVVKQAKGKWGVGWHRLSEDQQRTEIAAQAWYVLIGSARIEEALTDENDAALGRHTRTVVGLFRKTVTE